MREVPIFTRPLAPADLEERLRALYDPYYTACEALLGHLRDTYGYALLLDAHTGSPRRMKDHQVIIGTRHGATCPPGLAPPGAATFTGHAHRKLEIVTEVPESAMVVFAHPDDAEIGSGGVIARWVAAGCDVTYVLCTNGDAGTADRNLAPAELAQKRAHEQRAAADFMGVRHVEMLGYPDGYLEDTREFLGDVVRAIRRHRPHTVFVHDPYRMKGFQHRDHRKAGIVTTDAVYPYARDHLHFADHITREGLEPHKVRELS